jgi:splicing factor 3A subunit 1
MTDTMDTDATLAVVPGAGPRTATSRRGPAPVVPSQTKVVGIIAPPPDVRAIVDKTAQFVARNGEKRE